MTMVDCPNCRSPLSEAAVSCPRCGQPLRRNFIPLIIALTGIAMLVTTGVVVAVIMLAKGSKTGSSTSSGGGSPVSRGTPADRAGKLLAEAVNLVNGTAAESMRQNPRLTPAEARDRQMSNHAIARDRLMTLVNEPALSGGPEADQARALLVLLDGYSALTSVCESARKAWPAAGAAEYLGMDGWKWKIAEEARQAVAAQKSLSPEQVSAFVDQYRFDLAYLTRVDEALITMVDGRRDRDLAMIEQGLGKLVAAEVTNKREDTSMLHAYCAKLLAEIREEAIRGPGGGPDRQPASQPAATQADAAAQWRKQIEDAKAAIAADPGILGDDPNDWRVRKGPEFAAEKTRQDAVRKSLADANAAMEAKKWAEAREAYRKAKGLLLTTEAESAANIDRKVDETFVNEVVDVMVADGDKLLADGKFLDARKKFVELKQYANDLRRVAAATQPVEPNPKPSPTSRPGADESRTKLAKVPGPLIDKIEHLADSKIKHVDFARYMFEAKTDMANKQWVSAWNWLKLAEREAQSKEDQDQVRSFFPVVHPRLPVDPAPGAN